MTNINFELTDGQQYKLNTWIRLLPQSSTTTIGDRFSYTFIPTSVGVFITVKDFYTGKEIELTDYL